MQNTKLEPEQEGQTRIEEPGMVDGIALKADDNPCGPGEVFDPRTGTCVRVDDAKNG